MPPAARYTLSMPQECQGHPTPADLSEDDTGHTAVQRVIASWGVELSRDGDDITALVDLTERGSLSTP